MKAYIFLENPIYLTNMDDISLVLYFCITFARQNIQQPITNFGLSGLEVLKANSTGLILVLLFYREIKMLCKC